MKTRTALIPITILLLLPLALAEGITVNQPTGTPVSGTIGVSWSAWVPDSTQAFNVSFVHRTYDESGLVIAETRTLVCENVIGQWCDADTRVLANGTYALVVTSGSMESYSNDFLVENSPAPDQPQNAIVVMQPEGNPVSGTIGVSWYTWIPNESQAFNVSFAQRTYDGEGNVIAESRTLACKDVIGQWCDADTSILANGTYAIVVRSGTLEGYSNDFAVANDISQPVAAEPNGITVTHPSGVTVNGTIGVGWYAWSQDDAQAFNVSFVQRTYDAQGNVIGELRTPACLNIIGKWCDADTTVLADGMYAVAVTSGAHVGYSNDFQILNHPPHAPQIVVIEPRGVPLSGTGAISWNASDDDGDPLVFTAYLVQRTYAENGTVDGELSAPLCSTTGSSCTFDTRMFADGTYVVVVGASDGELVTEGYSNDFAISNGLILNESDGATLSEAPTLKHGRRRCCSMLYAPGEEKSHVTNTSSNSTALIELELTSSQTVPTFQMPAQETASGEASMTASAQEIVVPAAEERVQPLAVFALGAMLLLAIAISL